MSAKVFMGLLGLGVLGQKALQLIGTSETTIRGLFFIAGGVSVGIAADAGLNPLPPLIAAGKIAIQAGEGIIKQLPEIKEITSSEKK
jgi:hypothetical protein